MKLGTIAASVALLACAGSAFAQSSYVGVGVLRGGISGPGLSATILGTAVNGTGDKTTATGAKVYGGYNFDQNWGMELGYNNLGNKYSVHGYVGPTPYGISMKASNWYLAGTGTLPLSKEFSLLAKLGVAANRAEGGTACVLVDCVSVGSKNRSQLMYGVGASYAFSKNWGARLEYEHFGKLSNDNFWGVGTGGAIKGSAGTLSAKYTF